MSSDEYSPNPAFPQNSDINRHTATLPVRAKLRREATAVGSRRQSRGKVGIERQLLAGNDKLAPRRSQKARATPTLFLFCFVEALLFISKQREASRPESYFRTPAEEC